MIKAIIFDWDGVIADSIEVQLKSIIDICRILNKNCPFKTAEDLRKGYIEPYYDLYRSFGIDWEKEEDKIVEHYKAFCKRQKIDLFDNVVDVIKKLKEKGVILGLASSNREAVINHKIEYHGIEGLFDIIITEDHVTTIKPDPECINMAMIKLGVKPEETIFIGDMTADIIAGKAADVVTVAVTWGWMSRGRLLTENPDHIIDTPEELFKILEEHNAADHG